MMNSGSYFVIQASLFGYYFITYFVNKGCTFGARIPNLRRLGMLAYEDSYWNEFIKASYKLFLESYFDLVMCVLLNLFAFVKMDDEWSSFFATRDDALCSTVTVLWGFMVLFFPLIAWHLIHHNQG